MWLNMNCLCAIYVDRNQRAFLAQMMSFFVRYDVILSVIPFLSKLIFSIFDDGGWMGGVDSPVLRVQV